jgi:hypothetical protein
MCVNELCELCRTVTTSIVSIVSIHNTPLDTYTTRLCDLTAVVGLLLGRRSSVCFEDIAVDAEATGGPSSTGGQARPAGSLCDLDPAPGSY